MISIYILCFNEEIIISHTINFYRHRFPAASITILDNHSTDQTVKIARELGCEIYQFATDGKISDLMYQYLKNNCWKKSENQWILVCDCDEHLCITEGELINEESLGTNIISSEAYNMVNMNNDLAVASIDHGYRDNDVCQFYDKSLLFNKAFITDINYSIGAHSVIPDGNVKFSSRKYRLLHYKYISPDFMVARYKMYAERLSDDNKKNSWGANYLEKEGTIRALFEEYRKKSSKII